MSTVYNLIIFKFASIIGEPMELTSQRWEAYRNQAMEILKLWVNMMQVSLHNLHVRTSQARTVIEPSGALAPPLGNFRRQFPPIRTRKMPKIKEKSRKKSKKSKKSALRATLTISVKFTKFHAFLNLDSTFFRRIHVIVLLCCVYFASWLLKAAK